MVLSYLTQQNSTDKKSKINFLKNPTRRVAFVHMLVFQQLLIIIKEHRGKQDTFSIGWEMPLRQDPLQNKMSNNPNAFKIGWEVPLKPDGLTQKIGAQTQQHIPKHTTTTNPKYAPTQSPNVLTQNGAQVAQQGYTNYANGEFGIRGAKGGQQDEHNYGQYAAKYAPEPAIIIPERYQQEQPKYYQDQEEYNQYNDQYADQVPSSQYYDKPYQYSPQQGGYQNQNQNPQAQEFQPQYKQLAKKNMASNIFNTDMEDNVSQASHQSKRSIKKNQEIQNKGYGSFYNKNETGQFNEIPRATQTNRNQGPSSVFY